MKSEVRPNFLGNLRLNEADDQNYASNISSTAKQPNDHFNAAVKEIGDDFINALTRGEDVGNSKHHTKAQG